MVNLIYASELQLNKAYTSDTEAPPFCIYIYHFLMVVFPPKFMILYFFLADDVPRRPSYGVYISQLLIFTRMCRHVEYFNARNRCVTVKLHKQGYRYLKLRKAFF